MIHYLTSKEHDRNYIIVSLHGIPRRFWNGSDWTFSLKEAEIYYEYIDAINCLWDIIPADKIITRATICPLEIYKIRLIDPKPEIKCVEDRLPAGQ